VIVSVDARWMLLVESFFARTAMIDVAGAETSVCARGMVDWTL